MSGWSPPSPSNGAIAFLTVPVLLVLLYALFVQQNVLAGVLPVVVVVAGYVGWRFLAALEAIADGVHRLAHAREPAGADD